MGNKLNLSDVMKDNELYKMIKLSALIVIIGSLLSGPITAGIVKLTCPQPAWIDARTYLENYNWVQSLPIIFGFVFLMGNCLFLSSVIRQAKTEKEKILSNMAIIMMSVYAVIISVNYIIQIAYMKPIEGMNESIITILSMSNPFSLSWILEMSGYAFLGISLWLIVPLFKKKIIKNLIVLNGVFSVLGAVITYIDLSFPLGSVFGIISYIFWNILIVAIMVLIIKDYKTQ